MNKRQKWFAARLVVPISKKGDIIPPPELRTWEEEVVGKDIGMHFCYEGPNVHLFTDGEPYIRASELADEDGHITTIQSPRGREVVFTGFVCDVGRFEPFLVELFERAQNTLRADVARLAEYQSYFEQNERELEKMRLERLAEKMEANGRCQ